MNPIYQKGRIGTLNRLTYLLIILVGIIGQIVNWFYPLGWLVSTLPFEIAGSILVVVGLLRNEKKNHLSDEAYRKIGAE